MEEKISKNELDVLVIHPERVLFEGKAKAITSFNDRGLFDILPLHTNFVSLIKQKIIIQKLDGEKKEFPIEEAIMKVYMNQIWIFVGVKENVAGVGVNML